MGLLFGQVLPGGRVILEDGTKAFIKEQNLEGRYALSFDHFALNQKYLKLVFYIGKYTDTEYFYNIVCNKTMKIDIRMLKLLYALSKGTINFSNVSKKAAQKSYNRLVSIDYNSNDAVKSILSDELLENIAKEVYNILSSCDKKKTEVIIEIISERTVNTSFEAIGDIKI